MAGFEALRAVDVVSSDFFLVKELIKCLARHLLELW